MHKTREKCIQKVRQNHKIKKDIKKSLTIGEKSDIMVKLSRRKASRYEKDLKKIKKVLDKVILM